jgi:hypothetical protein
VISVYPSSQVTPLAVGAQTGVGANTLTTLATLTANGARNISRISCTGQVYAKYQIFVNSTLKETRISGPERSIDFVFEPTLFLVPTAVLDVKVTHFVAGENPDFETTIYGY